MPFDPSMKTIVIDDMMTMRKIITKMLKGFGFTNIEEADDGATAWPMIQEAKGSIRLEGGRVADINRVIR